MSDLKPIIDEKSRDIYCKMTATFYISKEKNLERAKDYAFRALGYRPTSKQIKGLEKIIEFEDFILLTAKYWGINHV